MDLFDNNPDDVILDDDEDLDDDDNGDIADEPLIAGLRHPRAMDISIGHEALEKNLIELTQSGRMPHSMIFAGPKGIGKATMAYRFARYILKNGMADPNQNSLFGDAPAAPSSLNVSVDDPVFRRVASCGHADMMSIERQYDDAKNRFKSAVDVEEVRKVAPFLRMTASDGGWRVVIIDDADTMTRSSQNAILKIFEEPPKNALVILIAHRVGALIPTIRSRARVVNFQPLGQDSIHELLLKQGHTLSASHLSTLVHLANGSIGKALHYISENGLDTLTQILTAFENYPRWNWIDLHMMAEDLSRNGREQAYQSFGELLQWVLGQLAVSKARGQALPTKALENEALQSLMRNSSLEQLLEICENLEGHFNKVEWSNLDKRQGVLGAFSLIAA